MSQDVAAIVAVRNDHRPVGQFFSSHHVIAGTNADLRAEGDVHGCDFRCSVPVDDEHHARLHDRDVQRDEPNGTVTGLAG